MATVRRRQVEGLMERAKKHRDYVRLEMTPREGEKPRYTWFSARLVEAIYSVYDGTTYVRLSGNPGFELPVQGTVDDVMEKILEVLE